MSMTKPTAEQITFAASQAGATQRTALSKFQDALNLADFGVVGDGVTDDTAAFAAAVAAQQASGKILVGMAGKNANLATWTRITCSSPFYFDGQYMTVTCGTPTSVEFIDCQNDFDIRNTNFQQWFRVLDCQLTANRIKRGIFSNNITYGRRKLNPSTGGVISNFAYQISIKAFFDDILIENNTIEHGFFHGIAIGGATANYLTTDYLRTRIIGNRITNITNGSGAGSVYGCICYGHEVEYIDNYIEGLDGSPTPLGGSFGNGCYGLYLQASFGVARGNYLKNIGTNTGLLASIEQWAINLKRCVQIVENNVIENVGKDTPEQPGGAISEDASPRMIARNNYCFNVGPGVFGSAGAVIDSNYVKLGNKTIVYPGVFACSATSLDPRFIMSNNVVEKPSGTTQSGSGAAFRMDTYALPDGANGTAVGNSVIDFSGAAFASGSGVNSAPVRNLIIRDNYIKGTSSGIAIGGSVINAPNDAIIENNRIVSVTTPVIPNSSIAGMFIRNNAGYVTRNTGKATGVTSGDTVSHGLVGTPELVFVTPLSSGVTDVTVTNLTSTTFVINFGGGGTKDFAWDAQHPRYNGRS